MDLTTGRLYWRSTCRRDDLAHPATRKQSHFNALIIGAGVTGALVADRLTQAGASVAIIDHRPVASGSTPASTALLQYEIDVPLAALIRKLGKTHAQAAYLASRDAVVELARLAHALGAATLDLHARPSLHLAHTIADARAFTREAAARRAIGIDAARLTSRELADRFALSARAAILSPLAYEINPLKLTYALLRRAVAHGAVIHPRTTAELPHLARKTRFRISVSGATLTADHLIIATGYETPQQFAEVAKRTELRATYALVTPPRPAPLSPWPHAALLWEAGDPYLYARTTADGRIMVGGEDEPFTTAAARDRLIPAKTRTLLRKLRALLPRARRDDLDPFPRALLRADYAWAGVFAQTPDGLPYIGKHPRWPNVHFALGYGGNGITFSLLASHIITQSILTPRSPHPAAPLFRLDRQDPR